MRDEKSRKEMVLPLIKEWLTRLGESSHLGSCTVKDEEPYKEGPRNRMCDMQQSLVQLALNNPFA